MKRRIVASKEVNVVSLFKKNVLDALFEDLEISATGSVKNNKLVIVSSNEKIYSIGVDCIEDAYKNNYFDDLVDEAVATIGRLSRK